MEMADAALVLAKYAAWEHQEYTDGGEVRTNCDLCRAIRYVRRHPKAVVVSHVRGIRSVSKEQMEIEERFGIITTCKDGKYFDLEGNEVIF
jgi:hypothetical protein